MTLLNSGIYKILNLITGLFYIGSAVRLSKRFERHRWEFENNRHSNIKLQRAYNKYGADAFEFIIIEIIEKPTKELLEAREQHYIDTLNPQYNLNPTAGSQLGSKRSPESLSRMSAAQKNKVWSEKGLANIRAASAKRRGKKLPTSHVINAKNGRKNWGHSEETKFKMRKAARANSDWPHEKGYNCNCNECKERRNSTRRVKPQTYTLIPLNVNMEF